MVDLFQSWASGAAKLKTSAQMYRQEALAEFESTISCQLRRLTTLEYQVLVVILRQCN